jgi:hypothetical protein
MFHTGFVRGAKLNPDSHLPITKGTREKKV